MAGFCCARAGAATRIKRAAMAIVFMMLSRFNA
jgi:hypothetical protein